MLYRELTRAIIGCGFEVSNELGSGFLESVYENAMLVALAGKGLRAKSQVPIEVYYRERRVGEFFADILVERKVIVELKAVRTLVPVHDAQVINFGNPKLEYRRYTRDR